MNYIEHLARQFADASRALEDCSKADPDATSVFARHVVARFNQTYTDLLAATSTEAISEPSITWTDTVSAYAECGHVWDAHLTPYIGRSVVVTVKVLP